MSRRASTNANHEIQRTYRRENSVWVSFAFLAWASLLLGIGAVKIVLDHPADSPWVPVVVVLACGAATFGGVAARFAFIGARTDAYGVRVRNPFRTYTVRWDDVDCFRLEQWGRHPLIGVLHTRRHGGIPIIAIRAAHGWLRSDPGPGALLIEQLNDELGLRRSHLGETSGEKDREPVDGRD